jgi:hypothetical protein
MKRKWRRGWDSDSRRLLKARKLLILGFATCATTASIALVGYTSGTHHNSKHSSLEVAA